VASKRLVCPARDRHVIDTHFNHRMLSDMATHDVASNVYHAHCPVARHVIDTHF
jgi:hypothetical protein